MGRGGGGGGGVVYIARALFIAIYLLTVLAAPSWLRGEEAVEEPGRRHTAET